MVIEIFLFLRILPYKLLYYNETEVIKMNNTIFEKLTKGYPNFKPQGSRYFIGKNNYIKTGSMDLKELLLQDSKHCLRKENVQKLHE